jgi:hypothetical protein
MQDSGPIPWCWEPVSSTLGAQYPSIWEFGALNPWHFFRRPIALARETQGSTLGDWDSGSTVNGRDEPITITSGNSGEKNATLVLFLHVIGALFMHF